MSTAVVHPSALIPRTYAEERTPMYSTWQYGVKKDFMYQVGLTAGLGKDQVPAPVRESPVLRYPFISYPFLSTL